MTGHETVLHEPAQGIVGGHVERGYSGHLRETPALQGQTAQRVVVQHVEAAGCNPVAGGGVSGIHVSD